MKNQKIINIAFAEVGYAETPANTNKTKYGKWFGYDGVPWCGIFVSWVYAQAGAALGTIGFKKGFAGCQTAVAHFKKTGEVTTAPTIGDLVFYDWNNDGRYDHVGIFNGWHDKGVTFYAIEGNTSMTNQSNGGQVMSRTRTVTNGVLFVHPNVIDSAGV